MELKDLLYWEKEQVKGFQVGEDRKAKFPSLIQLMYEAAMQQVLTLKMSARELAPMGLGWVLYRQHITLFRRPEIGEQLKILTHPSGTERLFTYRDFKMYDVNDELIAQAATTWFLFNIERRRIARYPDWIAEAIDLSNQLEHLERAQQFRLREGPLIGEKQLTVQYFDLDFNGHLSNYYFSRWMLEATPVDWLKQNELQEFQLTFKEECLLGDQLTIQVKQLDLHTLQHAIIRKDQIVAEGLTLWIEGSGM